MPRMLTEIINENNVIRKKLKTEGDKIVVEPPQKGRGKVGYFAAFTKDSILYYYKGFGPFKWLARKLVLMDGASECVKFHDKDAEIPRYDRAAVRRLFDAEVLQKAGTVNMKLIVPTVLYILIGGLMVLMIVMIMIQTGRLKL